MRKSKEVDVANISFIDLLAGALGAVMLLFVIVPKVSFSDLEKIESYEQILMEKQSLDSIIQSLESIVPKEDYQALVDRSASLQSGILKLQTEIERVQAAYSRQRDQYQSLVKEYESMKNELAEFRKNAIDPSKLQALQMQLTELKRENKELEELKKRMTNIQIKQQSETVSKSQETQSETPKQSIAQTDQAPETVVGINFPLAIVVEWDSPKDRVRLYMRQKGTNSWCFYQTKRQRAPFGRWNKDIQKLSNKTAEAITQDNELIPGEYEIYAQPVKSSAADNTVEVSGYIALTHPETKQIKRHNLERRKIALSKPPYSGDETATLLGTISVSENSFVWNNKN